MKNTTDIEPFLEAIQPWGVWGVFCFVFIVFGLKHVAPIIAAFGKIYNDRRNASLTHDRAMKKIDNQMSLKKGSKK